MCRSLTICLFVAAYLLGDPPFAAADEGLESESIVGDQSSMPSEVDFARDIRPLLSDRCFACHGPDEGQREADLRLDKLDSLLEDRGDYQVVAPGDPTASELVKRIISDDEYEMMPPPGEGKPLSTAEMDLLQRWIAAGASWKKHWAYEVPRAAVAPDIKDQSQRGENWIDAFVSERHRSVSGRFAEAADRQTLIRRLSFDLTGLPPDLATVRRLAESEERDVLDRYVDELLSSAAFGERLAMYWLDLVRFADTVGYHGDQDHSISPYRDYVIDVFNDARPFDAFTVDQLAGDLVENPSEEQVVATGYNRLLQTSHEGGVQPREYLAIYQADRVRNVSAVWMGATIGCAQCHDHKYDPYTSKDFYGLATFFADVDEEQHFKVGSNARPTRRPPEKDVLSRGQRLRLAGLEVELAEVVLRCESQAQNKAAAPQSGSAADEVDSCFNEAEPASALDDLTDQELTARKAALEKQIQDLRDSTRATMITVSVNPRTVRFLPRGNWLDDSGEVMRPTVPSFLGSLQVDGRPSRLDLAQWLTDSENGVGLLTSRVFVNRLWMLMFGTGLSKSVEDFGGQGEPPSHPQLLDQLALEFVRSGWDIKHMVRLIVGSRTYRQSSLETSWHREHDPQNRWLTRQNRFRVPAEMVRDITLACSELLVRQVGGASVKPYQPDGYYRHLNFPTRKYRSSDNEGQWRRGLYVHWQRQFLHPMLRAFDAPTREECTAQRSESNTPLAALVWLNDPSFIEAARGLALRGLHSEEVDDGQRVSLLFRIATSRSPDKLELNTLMQLLWSARQSYADDPEASRQLLAVGLMHQPSDFSDAELAAWTTVARAVLNLNETYTRN